MQEIKEIGHNKHKNIETPLEYTNRKEKNPAEIRDETLRKAKERGFEIL